MNNHDETWGEAMARSTQALHEAIGGQFNDYSLFLDTVAGLLSDDPEQVKRSHAVLAIIEQEGADELADAVQCYALLLRENIGALSGLVRGYQEGEAQEE